MHQTRLTGHIDQQVWNGIILKNGETTRFVELPTDVAARLERRQEVRLLFRRKRLVRIFNVTTNQLYETDFFASKPVWRKFQVPLFMAVAALCGIPGLGVLFGIALIAGLIGMTFRRSEQGALQVAVVSTVTALLYVGIGGYLLMTGKLLLAFLICTTLVFCALLSARTIHSKEAALLNQAVMG